jgi:phospholipase A-2-activating protein
MISSGRKDAALNPGEQSILKAVKETLESSKPVTEPGLNLVVKIVTQWPYTDRLAGLDLLRCIAPSPLAATYCHPKYGSIVQLAIDASLGADPGAAPNENCVLMAFRTIANLFASPDGRELCAEQSERVVSFMSQTLGVGGQAPIGKFNRNVLIALTTVAINYAVVTQGLLRSLVSTNLRTKLASMLGMILSEQTDSEVLYRALVALGTLLSTSADALSGLGVSGWVKTATGKAPEQRVKDVGTECLRLLR